MTMTEIPPGLRDAFGDRAAEIPDDYGAVMLARVGRQPRTPGPRVLALSAAALLAVALAGSALALSRRQPVVNYPLLGSTAVAASGSAPATSDLRLAGYRFALPAEFVPVADNCLPDVGEPDIPMAPGGAFASSPAGGCVSAVLVRGSALPAGGREVTVSGHPARILDRPGGVVLLYVSVPAPGPRFVLLAARGLTAGQLIAIADAGLR
jgi:hypothetical protein